MLLVNDDGINSLGLRLALDELVRAGHTVYVAVPPHDMSGSGKCFSFNIGFERVGLEGAEAAWIVTAPPAMIVYVALRALLPERPDVVFSGVNIGPNMGLEDFFTSGTVGAAIEASLQGVPSLAVSFASRKLDGRKWIGLTAGIGARLVGVASKLGAGNTMIVNVPPAPGGVAITSLAYSWYDVDLRYEDGVLRPVVSEDRIYVSDPPPGTDIWAVRRGLVSITPISLRRIAETAAEQDSHVMEEAVRIVRELLRGGDPSLGGAADT
ncbi:MAG: 5'/3'-nucleotidase SurE [Desulfurococcales archaeon]|nr:5'/3'-nucleotidase SurE [Desulfurococcales archaeon]